ncbi:sugar transferase [Erythrobacter sp. W53]|uniref:sugar transferase n=1 Tax=Erythrobacter sp. W53 TaxID=3425947 RepID=UPI003D766F14
MADHIDLKDLWKTLKEVNFSVLMRRNFASIAYRPTIRLRGSFRYAVCLLVGLAMPYFFWALGVGPRWSSNLFLVSITSAGIANFSCWYALERLREYAKSRQLSYVIPVNVVMFGAVFTIIGLLRLPYSISLIGGCFLGTLCASYLITAFTRRATNLNYVAKGGRADGLLGRDLFEPIENLGEFENLVGSKGSNFAIVADLHHDHPAEWERMFAKAALQGIPVYHYRQILEAQTGQVRIAHLSENDLGSLIPNLPYMAAKRAVDILSVLLLLPILLLAGAAIALAIKMTSSGSVLFFQERMGFRGQPFRMVKFRTMKEVDSAANDEDAARMQSMTKDKDGRITRVGHVLRKLRLDELPQAWNVLKGDMSWIGPRPEAIALSEWYEEEIPFYSYRHIVRPGITGWAQVNQGHVTDLDNVTDKLRFDFYYVKNVSLWLDVLIGLKTLRVLATGLGAK